MIIENDKVASIDYTLTNDTGETLDTSIGREPLTYIQGHQNIIPGLEKALEGKSAGDKINVTVPPEEAYGINNPALVQVVSKDVFQGVDNIEVGMSFQAQGDGGPIIVTVTKIEDDQITIDGNHPLSDMALTFDVEIKDVRDATEEEIAHGHIHGAEDHEH
ncbi:FKBP-type peptidyl-prolyl cis-trans isomerase SlyD [hydrothermal vent metagenome]|uniref:peptidylprolyl isomerase n=1 Tax=hydrothermal vent metagenome TaxID=652676 RepID=A0A3B1BYM6_9ZZZZ